ncbi:methyltransferase [Alistipes sp.]|uniref:tRNA1(Val) (adenine(37)-N6)-methyltransferase n=1 Tax=Alistipes sp. TaxID=1872444 RepID=UPI0025C39D2D|nr:methyltransferase [Alistipes sp.]
MFCFKQFAIRQDRCPMKVGTDGVLLGAWATVRPQERRLLDIGTGTGLIALMLAQRAPEARVTGVDIDDVGQARENADASPWGGRVTFAQCPVQEFVSPDPFDLIVSNPPFFVDSLTCPDRGRTAARHAVHLPFGDLRDAVLRLLAPEGRFAVILPTAEAERFRALCAGRLALVRRTDVCTTPRHPAKRALMEFVRADLAAAASEVSQLIVGTGEHECYTPEYRALTRDFYLKF